jgi:hypothetical protein
MSSFAVGGLASAWGRFFRAAVFTRGEDWMKDAEGDVMMFDSARLCRLVALGESNDEYKEVCEWPSLRLAWSGISESMLRRVPTTGMLGRLAGNFASSSLIDTCSILLMDLKPAKDMRARKALVN